MSFSHAELNFTIKIVCAECGSPFVEKIEGEDHRVEINGNHIRIKVPICETCVGTMKAIQNELSIHFSELGKSKV